MKRDSFCNLVSARLGEGIRISLQLLHDNIGVINVLRKRRQHTHEMLDASPNRFVDATLVANDLHGVEHKLLRFLVQFKHAVKLYSFNFEPKLPQLDGR